MAMNVYLDPDLEWLDHVPPVGLVVAPSLIKELGLSPSRQTSIDTGMIDELVGQDSSKPVFVDPWTFVERVLGWEARHIAGAPGGPALPDELIIALPEHGTTLRPTWAVAELGETERPWQLLVRVEAHGVDPDARNVLDGWEATPHQRFERLLRDTNVFAGLLISEREHRQDGEVRYSPELRLIYAPRGETSGHQSFPIRPMATVAGRPMLGGLKLLLDRFRLFSDADDRRLPALFKRSREAQAQVSIALAEQVLGALHELLRGLDGAEPALVRDFATHRPDHLYEGLLAILMRLVFVLYAEDRDLLPSRSDARAREIYEAGYSVRGLYTRLTEDATLNPDTMDERRGGWGRLLALFRLIHKGHKTRFIQARGGKLFDPEEFPFLEGRVSRDDSTRILAVSDGCLLRVLEGLMTLKRRGGERERLSYRTLDVEQIGSVYETVMGFTVQASKSRVLAIKAGKNNKTPVFVALNELLSKKGKDRIKDLKENVGRTLTAAQRKSIEAAKTVEDLAAALDGMVDERGSPKRRIAASGTPILQPTGERRRTGSHYTPRSLTTPIVKYVLEPTFERLGPDAKAEQVLDLKVCDPAMGSGAFLVEACRALGERLIAAWARWPETRPKIPADEDEELHARRLVAQRCLYGVDKNPRAVDLARRRSGLPLWHGTMSSPFSIMH
ncbi:N-6 DNA methylase [Streptomyces sp. AcH 505]|uniref:N-6 DNA methylase n=1 Tax=Streptomyces sp. AcH 505 TaxID=352211 RepID=UPI000A461357